MPQQPGAGSVLDLPRAAAGRQREHARSSTGSDPQQGPGRPGGALSPAPTPSARRASCKTFFSNEISCKNFRIGEPRGRTDQSSDQDEEASRRGTCRCFFFYFVLFCSRRNHLQMSCRNRVACHHGGMDRCLALWGRVRRGKGHGRQQLLVICPHRVTCCDRKIARRCISSDLFEI